MAAATAEAPPEVLKTAPEMALERGSETAPLSQLALNLLPWLSFTGDGHLTWSDNASSEDSMTRVRPKVGWLLVAEALMWSFEQAPFARLSCGRPEMMTSLLWFMPWRTEENGQRRWLVARTASSSGERANEWLL